MKNLFDRNNTATIISFIIAVIAGLEMIDIATFDLKRDWFKLLICMAIAIKGYLVSFNGKSLNDKAKTS